MNDIMTSKVKTAEGTATVLEAAVLMERSKIGSLVITSRGVPVGIVTEGDISRAVAKKLNVEKVTLKSIMGQPLITAKREMRIEEAAKLMADSKIKKLPVVDYGKLVGVVTQTDIVGASFSLVTSLKEMVRARYTPPDFEP
ncbi:MAG: CBS domain-containing protein [Nitrososphaerales archaeon]